eukprot:CAMPEP_0172674002 /NCGR_PEP_ID=MMETSP1074-20121228/12494_1 /TAXON_ID=2916 /ORGANISM="Ceratium fusus, Strain PA161109" /LENGTH=189 /DNA_ID=CAMNT_0013491377 /DNA_START=129 /DNA_END=696 /DNA_ORIENTATION=-
MNFGAAGHVVSWTGRSIAECLVFVSVRLMDRSNLRCANPDCIYKVHEEACMGGFCCKRCHWLFTKQNKKKGAKQHGTKCQRRWAVDGDCRADCIAPDSPLGGVAPQEGALPKQHEPSDHAVARDKQNQEQTKGQQRSEAARLQQQQQQHWQCAVNGQQSVKEPSPRTPLEERPRSRDRCSTPTPSVRSR